MAKSTTKSTTVITVELSPQEAYYLKTLLQNGPEGEDASFANMRGLMFEALPPFGELSKYGAGPS